MNEQNTNNQSAEQQFSHKGEYSPYSPDDLRMASNGWSVDGEGINEDGENYFRVSKQGETKDVFADTLPELNEKLANQNSGEHSLAHVALRATLIARLGPLPEQAPAEPPAIRFGDRVPVPTPPNPSRVIGHPSNPATAPLEAYNDQLREQ